MAVSQIAGQEESQVQRAQGQNQSRGSELLQVSVGPRAWRLTGAPLRPMAFAVGRGRAVQLPQAPGQSPLAPCLSETQASSVPAGKSEKGERKGARLNLCSFSKTLRPMGCCSWPGEECAAGRGRVQDVPLLGSMWPGKDLPPHSGFCPLNPWVSQPSRDHFSQTDHLPFVCPPRGIGGWFSSCPQKAPSQMDQNSALTSGPPCTCC